MIQEDKDLLLLKDLCARLSHKVKVHCEWNLFQGDRCSEDGEIVSINIYSKSIHFKRNCGRIIEIPFNRIDGEVLPYLRPISSMTEEEMDKLFDILHIDKDGKDEDWIKINDDLGIKFFFPTGKWIENVADAYDYLYSIHIDFRGLITKGLAIEVTKRNNPYK